MGSDSLIPDGPAARALIVGQPRFELAPFTRAASEIRHVTPDDLPDDLKDALPDDVPRAEAPGAGPVHLVIDASAPEVLLASMSRNGALEAIAQIEVFCTAAPEPLIRWLRTQGFALIDRAAGPDGAVLVLQRDAEVTALRAELAQVKAELKQIDMRFRAARTQADDSIRAAKAEAHHRAEVESRMALVEADRADLAARLAASETARQAQTDLLDQLDALVDGALQAPPGG